MTNIKLPEVTRQLLAAKEAEGVTFADLEAKLGRDEVWIAAVIYRQASASVEEATQLLDA